jgi:hypothetical protein
MVSRAKSKWYEHQNYEKLVLNSKQQTYQFLTNEAEVLNEVLLVVSLLYQGLKKLKKLSHFCYVHFKS